MGDVFKSKLWMSMSGGAFPHSGLQACVWVSPSPNSHNGFSYLNMEISVWSVKMKNWSDWGFPGTGTDAKIPENVLII